MRTPGCARRSGGADQLASGRRSADCPVYPDARCALGSSRGDEPAPFAASRRV